MSDVKLDGRLAERIRLSGDVEELARWWSQASEEARWALLAAAAQTGKPPLAQVQLAAYIAEADAGNIEAGEG